MTLLHVRSIEDAINMTPSPNPTPSAPDPIAIITAIGSVVGGLFYGIWLFISRRNPGLKASEPESGKQALISDVDRAFDFAEDYRERLRQSESDIQTLRAELMTSKTDCLQQIEAVNASRDKQLAAVILDYDSKIDRLTGRVRELEAMASGDGK